jgi:hypothetical protein
LFEHDLFGKLPLFRIMFRPPALARKHQGKQKRTGPESRADALGEVDVVLIEWLPVF